MKEWVPSEDVRQIIGDSRDKILLFMGHKVRVHNQRKRIDEIFNGMEKNECMLVLDYKMKFEPIYFREKNYRTLW